MIQKPQKIKLLAISRAYGTNAGGMERLSFELLQELSHMNEVEVETIVHTVKSNPPLQTTRIKAILFVLSVLPRALWKARSADIVHIGDPVLSLVGWCIQTILKKPVVVAVHGLDVTYSLPFYKKYLHTFFRSFAKYIAISPYAASVIPSYIPKEKQRIIPPGVYDRFFDSNIAKQQLLDLLHIQTLNPFIIGTAGRLVGRKGQAWFIEHVMPHLSENIHYVVVGDGPDRLKIEQLIQQKNLMFQVHVLGKVSDDVLKVFYNSIDIFIQPNIRITGEAEGFGLVLLEAALCEKLVLASNIEGIPAAIHNGKNGFLLEPENPAIWKEAIESAYNQSGQKQTVARQYTLENFSWSTIAETYKDTLQLVSRM